jgi:tRNA uridine 5-carboxymethylaminomethyl modification enzyme
MAERDALARARPESLAQARRIEGVTPAGLVKLLGFVRRFNKAEVGGARRGVVDEEGDGGKVVVEGLDVTGVEDFETLDAKSRVAEL